LLHGMSSRSLSKMRWLLIISNDSNKFMLPQHLMARFTVHIQLSNTLRKGSSALACIPRTTLAVLVVPAWFVTNLSIEFRLSAPAYWLPPPSSKIVAVVS
jgi:hypothetical protein